MDQQALSNLIYPMKNAYESLARALGEGGVDPRSIKDVYDAHFDQVKTLLEEISSLRQEIEELKNKDQNS